MGPVEITIIVIAVAIVAAFIVTYIVRKAKGKPTGECACCPYAKECGQSKNSCGCHSQSIDLSQYIRNDNSENDNNKDNSENNDNKNN